MEADDRRPCRIVLVGMMGSGKSTVGRLLAEATGWPYVDNDDLVLRESGVTAREVLAEGGQERLREVETRALRLGLELEAPVIIGVAAGTILDASNRDAMRSRAVVAWLRARIEVLIERAMSAEHRPFVDTAGPDWLVATAVEREPMYAEVADVAVDTGDSTPAESVAAIRKHLATVPGCAEPA